MRRIAITYLPTLGDQLLKEIALLELFTKCIILKNAAEKEPIFIIQRTYLIHFDW